MDIRYIEKDRIFVIETDNTSYVMGIVDEEGFLGHFYYGDKIGSEDSSYLLSIIDPQYTPSSNNRDRSSFLDRFPFEYPGSNVGDYRNTGVEITDANGNGSISLCYESHNIYKGKKELEGLPATFGNENDSMTLEISLVDKVVGLRAVLSYSVFEGIDAIARSVRFENISSEALFLNKAMSMMLDMEDEAYQLLTLHGSWARERMMEIRNIGYGDTFVESFRGESSHQFHPFMALVQDGDSQDNGKVYGFSFVYSGNFQAGVCKSQFDSLRLYMGICEKNFCWKLDSGDVFTAPEVIMNYSSAGLGKMTHTFHDLFRNHLIRSPYKDKERPVLINNWEATYFDFDSEKLIAIARQAQKSGIEMLVMDDGWFGERNDDNTSLGDWYVNENKIKGGLKKLVDEVNAIGLKFGIWMEPEMISPASKLYKAHPDWAISVPGREACRSRNQFVLDITREEVFEYVYGRIKDILSSANIEYLKWDMNRQLSDLGSAALGKDRQGELSHRYMLAVYALQDRLIKDFPNLLLENCSGGGARYDAGMLYYSPQIWCSDDTDAIERLKIQEGTSLVFPLSTMGAHVSDCPNHTVGRITPFKTRGDVALSGTFGYELDITKIPAEDRAAIPGQIANYHKYNELVRKGDYYRLASYRQNHEYDAWMITQKDGRKALITYVQVVAFPNGKRRIIKPKALDDSRIYEIWQDDNYAGAAKGTTLKNAGIAVPILNGDYRSMLIYLVAKE
ncbi:alpha-galactosidase [Butyrivibrio sp. YAB3001]|uniref:alpha-galactosidase n=1 Tax=Butyrivibrio sp. YAB3001 TaxID=1520812 RepID=UPI0008F67138|nr:alpha-galactosidase [Butyrivibrio sp. YAB3001]SFC99548.1 alpha-galactosidase [Butyrivibrio sp. YAB3001]